jgi:NAD(P)-dependent dehydrogenase (short-subunit alcohol dehydrogenase family)
MHTKKVWFITGAGRGMGVDIAKAALAAGNAVVATGRNIDTVRKAIGQADDLLVVTLDITDPASARAAVQAAVERFGRIDVLVNNAGNFIAGFFEEITPEDYRAQLETNLFGPLNVTRAVLPVMRGQRSGLVVTMSSTVGLVGQEFCTAYAASKFALEGWSESLTPEVAPYRRQRTNPMNPVYDFTGQVALVTGASSGIGRATAQAFAEAGAAVVLVDINETALRAATEALASAGHRAIGVTCNVADEAQAAAMVERTVATFGRLDMAFNRMTLVS